MRIVIAIGGNALIRASERGTWAEQLDNARPVAAEVVSLHRAGHEVVIIHGNGPQVGTLLLAHAADDPRVPALPLDVLGAMSQGEMGYLIQTAIAECDPRLATATLLTRVAVDADDPALAQATKPVGPFYSEAEAGRLARERGWTVAPDAGRGWRRMVPSPHPREIVELEQIRSLVRDGFLVIACGGGGIPVVRTDRSFTGVAAVIDKDRTATDLALALEADVLVLATAVRRVAQDFGTRWQRELDRLTVDEANRLLADGEFPPGSMGPKIEAAQRFVAAGGRAAIVTSPGRLRAAVDGDDGTWIVEGSVPAVAA